MIEKNEMKIAELLCSKLCHDLISPIGAINNGVEILTEDSSNMAEEATNLIGSSARQAADRLAYFRMALGAGGSADTVEFDTIKDLVESVSVEKKWEISWTGIESYTHANINMLAAKLILNLAIISFDCLPRGGKVEFAMENNRETISDFPDMNVTVSGEKCNLRADVKTGFDSDISEDLLTVRNILPFYSINLANNSLKSLKIDDQSPSLILFCVS